jgi:hypothetical protein
LANNYHNDVGHLDEAMMARFRCGAYEEQTVEVQKAFLFCMLTLLPCINSEWQRTEVTLHNLVSKKTTTSDEALLHWYLACYEAKWVLHYDEDVQALNNGQPLPTRKKEHGKHMARVNLYKFIAMEDKVKEARDDPEGKGGPKITGNGWDQAVKAEATRLHQLKRGETQALLPIGVEAAPKHNYTNVCFDNYVIEPFEV